MNGTQATSGNVLCWPRRLLSADDLRRHLNGQRELMLLPKTIITPLAADELRAKGVRLTWQAKETPEDAPARSSRWVCAIETPDPLIAAAVQALERDGVYLAAIHGAPRAIAENVVAANYLGGIVFTGDKASAVCIANKIAGVRAASVASAAQVRRAKLNLGANLFVIETPGPTYFEARQMLRLIVANPPVCRDEIAKVLTELDGHAHR